MPVSAATLLKVRYILQSMIQLPNIKITSCILSSSDVFAKLLPVQCTTATCEESYLKLQLKLKNNNKI